MRCAPPEIKANGKRVRENGPPGSKRSRKSGLRDVLALFLLKSGDHPPDRPMFRARRQYLETGFLRPPFQNIDINVADAPTAHLEPAGFVQVDRVGTDQRSTVIVDDIFVFGADDSEVCAQRETRPIGRGAHDMMASQASVQSIMPATSFGMSVGSGADMLHPARICFGGIPLAYLLLLCATGQNANGGDAYYKVKAFGNLQHSGH